MIPVDQAVSDRGVGDCQRAAIASLLGLPLQAVPHFILCGKRWWPILYYFMYANGWERMSVFDASLPVPPERTVNGYTHATVKSRNFEGVTHSVVIDCNKICVHDPSPNKNFQGIDLTDSPEFVQYYVFTKRTDDAWLSIERNT